jgi:RHS repeat-associated protein
VDKVLNGIRLAGEADVVSVRFVRRDKHFAVGIQNRETASIAPNPSTGLASGGLTTSYGYDANSGRLATVTDPMSNVSTYVDDALGRRLQTILPNPVDGTATGTRPTTTWTYDGDSNTLSEVDPDSHQTSYTYGLLDQLASQSETVALSYAVVGGTPIFSTADVATTYVRNNLGDLVEKIAPDNQAITYAYNTLGQRTQEQWFADASHAVAGTSVLNSIAYGYDVSGIMNSAVDSYDSTRAANNSNDSFTVNSLGEVTSVDNNGGLTGGTPGVPRVVLISQYDLNGNRTALGAAITPSGGSAMTDFQDAFTYDALNRQTSAAQLQQAHIGSSSVNAATGLKRYMSYDNDSRLTGIGYYDNTSIWVSTGSKYYDHAGRLTGITWYGAGSGSGSGSGGGGSSSVVDNFAWTYDNDSRVTAYSNSVYSSENKSYSYDHNAQLTGAGSTSYFWDANGDSIASGVVTGAGNRLLYDGTYSYAYDKNGNVLSQVSSTHETDYVWDQRNRLVSVKDYSISNGTSSQVSQVDYSYDVFDRLQGRTLTLYTGGTAGTPSTARFVFDGKNMVLAFNGTGALTDRYFWGAAVDEILADEQFTPTTSGQLPTNEGTGLWAMTDNLGTVRDLVTSSGVVDHLVVDAFGNRTWQSNSSTSERIGYTGAFYDPTTGLVHDGVRWYKPSIERWLSEDPSGLGADSNPYRYVGNSPTNSVDSTGLNTIGGGVTGDLTLFTIHFSIALTINVSLEDVSIGVTTGGGPAAGMGFGGGLEATHTNARNTEMMGGPGRQTGYNTTATLSGAVVSGDGYSGISIGGKANAGGGVYSDETQTTQATGLWPWNPDAQWWFGMSNPLSPAPAAPPPVAPGQWIRSGGGWLWQRPPGYVGPAPPPPAGI